MKVGDIIQNKILPNIVYLITNIRKTKYTITYTFYDLADGREHMVENTLNHDRIILKYDKVS